MARRTTRYDVYVNAEDAGSAIEIAAEALPKQANIIQSDARDVSDDMGAGIWLVTLRYST